MEKVAATVFFPCKYHSSGCLGTFLHDKKVAHEGNIFITIIGFQMFLLEICEYRPYHCPCPGASCKWQGNLDGVMEHLLNQHKVKYTFANCPWNKNHILDYHHSARWRYCFLGNRCNSSWCCWLGNDAKLFWQSFYACIGETGKIRRSCSIFCW